MRGKPPKSGTPAPGRPPKHGSRALSRFVRENKLDRRTWLSRFIEQAECIIAEDQGGLDKLTRREAMLVTLAANQWVEWQLVQWHRQQASLRGELTHESDKYYLAMVNSLRRTLETLGLRPERVENRISTLEQYLAAKAAEEKATPGSAGGSQSNEPTRDSPNPGRIVAHG